MFAEEFAQIGDGHQSKRNAKEGKGNARDTANSEKIIISLVL
jgi:hypothetical protein